MKYRHKETGIIYNHAHFQKMWEFLTNSLEARIPGKSDAAVNSRDDVSCIADISKELECDFDEHYFCYSCVAAHQVHDEVCDCDCDEHSYVNSCKYCPLISDWVDDMPCLNGLYDDWWFSYIYTRAEAAAKIAALPVVNPEWEALGE